MTRPAIRRNRPIEPHTFDDLGLLDDWLPTFDHAVAITTSPAVMMSQTGRYAPLQRAGTPFTCAPEHVTLRLPDPGAGTVSLWTGQPGNDAPASLELRGRDDQVLHRIYLSTDADLRRLRAFAAVASGGSAAGIELPRRTPRRSLMSRLVEGSTAEHVDAMLRDGGCARRQALPVLGLDLTQQVDPVIGVHALVHLRAMQVPLTVAVPTPGLLHAVAGPIESFYQVGAKVSIGMGTCTTTVDTAAVGECWVTRPETGPAMLELYDRQDTCVAVVTLTGPTDPVHAARWDHVMAMTCLS